MSWAVPVLATILAAAWAIFHPAEHPMGYGSVAALSRWGSAGFIVLLGWTIYFGAVASVH
jgi:hypothetical protein